MKTAIDKMVPNFIYDFFFHSRAENQPSYLCQSIVKKSSKKSNSIVKLTQNWEHFYLSNNVASYKFAIATEKECLIMKRNRVACWIKREEEIKEGKTD